MMKRRIGGVALVLLAWFVAGCTGGGGGVDDEQQPISQDLAKSIATDLFSRGRLNLEMRGFRINESGEVVTMSSGTTSATSYAIFFSDIVFSAGSDLTANVVIENGATTILSGKWRPDAEREISIRPTISSAWYRFEFNFENANTVKLTYKPSSSKPSSSPAAGPPIAEPLPSWLTGAWCFASDTTSRMGLIRGMVFLNTDAIKVYFFDDPQARTADLMEVPSVGNYFNMAYWITGINRGHTISLKVNGDSGIMDEGEGDLKGYADGSVPEGTIVNHYRKSSLTNMTANTTIDQACP